MALVSATVFLALALNADSLTERAAASYFQRDFRKAEQQLREALRVDPRNAPARIQLARTLVELDRIPEALEEIQRALEIQPRAPETELNAGKLLEELASSRFTRLQTLAPDSPELREIVGRQWEARGNLDRALTEYRAALEKDPARSGTHFLVGNVLWKMRNPEAALPEFKSELERNPQHSLANLRVGQILVASNQPAKAIPFLKVAAGSSIDARRELGKALRQVGDYRDARRELEAVTQARPNDRSAHALLAQVYRALGDPESAKRELEIHRKLLADKREASEKNFRESQRK
jgi:tetratricopeptide (TPR) repeat protein